MTDLATHSPLRRALGLHSTQDLARFGVVLALVALILFGWARYENFLSSYNILTFLRYNSMFALIALGMCFVIITGGIDLSVGGVAAMASVVAAHASNYGLVAGVLAGTGAGLLVGLLNGLIITRLKILPFITTLATMLAAYGTALLLGDNQSVSVSYDTGFTEFGQGDFLGFPVPAWVAILAYLVGWLVLEQLPAGRRILAIGGGEDASRLMGLAGRPPARRRLCRIGRAGRPGRRHPRLAIRRGATDRRNWLGAVRHRLRRRRRHPAVRRRGSVGATLAGAMLLAMIFNLLNFENGLGVISLSAYWQSVIRGFSCSSW